MTKAAKELLTVREVAEASGVHIDTVRRWLRKGIYTMVLVGPNRLVRIPRSEVAKMRQVVHGVSH